MHKMKSCQALWILLDNIMSASWHFSTVIMSGSKLSHNNYRIALIGFSWNSKSNYFMAQDNAKDNGPLLAQFIVDFKKICPDSNIRLMAHSLGAAVAVSTLVSLDTNPTLQVTISNNNTKLIKSVHLLAAAIDNKLIVNNSAFANATEHLVDGVYNLYDPEDDGLQFNREYQGHDPLGLVGAPSGSAAPSNYNDKNVAHEIPPLSDADGDGNALERFEDIKPARLWGDNHCGYIGFRQPFVGSLIDDGAMNIVVRDWIAAP
jgi:pimeloyl-ACP methyl ester carboxylesterase